MGKNGTRLTRIGTNFRKGVSEITFANQVRAARFERYLKTGSAGPVP
jgi:hypothetical protein